MIKEFSTVVEQDSEDSANEAEDQELSAKRKKESARNMFKVIT